LQALSSKSKIGVYFSAHWCGPCRGFTPVASAAYKELKESGEAGFEIVFVSADSDQKAFDSYFGEMPWIAIPYDKVEDVKDALESKFNVRGIPQLSIIEPDGTLVTNSARELIAKYGKNSFPFTPPHLDTLALQQREKSASIVQDLAAKHLPAMLGVSLDSNTQYIYLALGAPQKDLRVAPWKLSRSCFPPSNNPIRR
jgi:thiol-disulfide isomerase/thioredoxin